jgi:hypothetical protein
MTDLIGIEQVGLFFVVQKRILNVKNNLAG